MNIQLSPRKAMLGSFLRADEWQNRKITFFMLTYDTFRPCQAAEYSRVEASPPKLQYGLWYMHGKEI